MVVLWWFARMAWDHWSMTAAFVGCEVTMQSYEDAISRVAIEGVRLHPLPLADICARAMTLTLEKHPGAYDLTR